MGPELSNLGQKASEFVARTKDALRKRYNPVEGCGRVFGPRLSKFEVRTHGMRTWPSDKVRDRKALCKSAQVSTGGVIDYELTGEVIEGATDSKMICNEQDCRHCLLPKIPLN